MATHPAVAQPSLQPEPGRTEPDKMPVFSSNAEVRAWLGLAAVPSPLPEWKWVANDEWRMSEGLLADHLDHDTLAMKRRDQIEEEEHDARKFGRTAAS